MIAVKDFEAVGISENEAKILTDRFRVSLFQTNRFKIIERDKIDAILEERGFQKSDCISDECIVEICRLLGVEKMFAGSIGNVNSLYIITIRYIDIKTGEVSDIFDFKFNTEFESLLTLIKSIATRLSRVINKYDVWVNDDIKFNMNYDRNKIHSIIGEPFYYNESEGRDTVDTEKQPEAVEVLKLDKGIWDDIGIEVWFNNNLCVYVGSTENFKGKIFGISIGDNLGECLWAWESMGYKIAKDELFIRVNYKQYEIIFFRENPIRHVNVYLKGY